MAARSDCISDPISGYSHTWLQYTPDSSPSSTHADFPPPEMIKKSVYNLKIKLYVKA